MLGHQKAFSASFRNYGHEIIWRWKCGIPDWFDLKYEKLSLTWWSHWHLKNGRRQTVTPWWMLRIACGGFYPRIFPARLPGLKKFGQSWEIGWAQGNCRVKVDLGGLHEDLYIHYMLYNKWCWRWWWLWKTNRVALMQSCLWLRPSFTRRWDLRLHSR